MRTVFCAFGISVALLAGAGHAAAGTVYSVDWSVADTASNLYTLDLSTGAATLVGSTGVARFIGLSTNSSNVLYAVNESDLGPASELYTINPTTGAARVVGSTGFNIAEGDLVFGPTGTLYVADALADVLYTINTTTGAATLVGGFGAAGRDVSGLEFVGSTLCGVALNDAAPDTLVTINTSSGAATTVGDTGTNLGIIAALAYDASTNTSYLAGPLTSFGSDNQLYSVNLTSGAASHTTAITGIANSISGIAEINTTAVPEASAVRLLALGAIGLVVVQWFRRRAQPRV